MKARVANDLHQLEAYELVTHRVLHFREVQADAALLQDTTQFPQHVSGSNVDARHGLGRHDDSSDSSGVVGDRFQKTILKQFGVREEEWGVPTKQQQPRNSRSMGIALHVMVAA